MFGFETLRNILKPLKNYTNGFKVLRGFDRFENVTKRFFRFVQVSETLVFTGLLLGKTVFLNIYNKHIIHVCIREDNYYQASYFIYKIVRPMNLAFSQSYSVAFTK